jgi:hypothetical protein
MRKMSKAEEAYRKSVKPLAYLFILGGIMMVQIFFVFPNDMWIEFPAPFFYSILSKKLLMIFVDLLFLFIGIGLLKRFKPAWYALFAYISIGSLWLALGGLFGYFPNQLPGYMLAILALIINGGIGTGIYFITKPAFIEAEH